MRNKTTLNGGRGFGPALSLFHRKPKKPTGLDIVLIVTCVFRKKHISRPEYCYIHGRARTEKLFIVEHSLDMANKDALYEILAAGNVEATIYYHSKDANTKQIKNLIKLLGYDKLNELTRGRGRSSSITFSPQP